MLQESSHLKDTGQETPTSNTTIFCSCWPQKGHLDFVQFPCLVTTTKRRKKPGVVAYTCNLSIWKVEIGGSEIQGHAQLYSEFKNSLDYVSTCLKQNNKKATFKEARGSWKEEGTQGRTQWRITRSINVETRLAVSASR